MTGDAIGRANLDGSSPDQSFIDLSGAVSGPIGVGRRPAHLLDDRRRGRACGPSGTGVDLHLVATGDSNHMGSGRRPAPLLGEPTSRHDWAGQPRWFLAGPGLHIRSQRAFRCGSRSSARSQCDHRRLRTSRCAPAGGGNLHSDGHQPAGLNPPTGTVDFTASGPGSFGPPANCSLITIGATQSTCQQTFAAAAAGIDSITAAYRGDTFSTPSSGTAGVTVLAAHPSGKPANSFTLSRPQLNKRNGTAILIATVPGSGALLLTGKGLKKLSKSVSHPGRVQLSLSAQPDTSRRLGRTGRTKVTAQVPYTPTGGDPNTKSPSLTLRSGRR